MGASGLLAVDFDVYRDAQGNVLTDGLENFGEAFFDFPDMDSLPTTFKFDSVSGAGGEQYIYRAPEGKELGPTNPYRGIKGLDTRAGGSYSVFTAAPKSFDEFAEAPEWACDERVARDLSLFNGDSREWFESLVPGEPSAAVRAAIKRAEERFTDQSNDLSHDDIIKFQHHAVRLGAEGNPGVEVYLDRLKELVLNREGEHSRNPDDYEHEFAEALASGIRKYGDSIALLKELPDFTTRMIPPKTPERLVSGQPGDRALWSEALRSLTEHESDDLIVLSILWNAPTTRDLSRDWGLELTHKRIMDARKNPEPVGENPILAMKANNYAPTALLSPEDYQRVKDHPTFIDKYLAASAKKGFANEHYDIPAAWTLLSMAFGRRAIVPLGRSFGVNLWYIVMGESGSGKSSSLDLLTHCLDLMLKDGESFYNLGANSSPEGMHETLLGRDGKPSMILHDEAADFFENLKRKDWMSGLKDMMADWYGGRVPPSNKIRLKELKGKSATTSFNISMLGTPSRILPHIDTGMFQSGFLARVNWGWAPPPPDDDVKYLVSRHEVDGEGIPPEAYRLVTDLFMATRAIEPKTRMDWTDEAEDRLVFAHRDLDQIAKGRDHYDETGPSVTRLKETMWKCAALLALWRGETVIREIDAMTAIYYAEDWFNTLFRVVEAAGEGDFNRDVNAIEAYVGTKDGVTKPMLLTRFKGQIQRNARELDDKIDFLVNSGRIIRGDDNRYRINGRKEGA